LARTAAPRFGGLRVPPRNRLTAMLLNMTPRTTFDPVVARCCEPRCAHRDRVGHRTLRSSMFPQRCAHDHRCSEDQEVIGSRVTPPQSSESLQCAVKSRRVGARDLTSPRGISASARELDLREALAAREVERVPGSVDLVPRLSRSMRKLSAALGSVLSEGANCLALQCSLQTTPREKWTRGAVQSELRSNNAFVPTPKSNFQTSSFDFRSNGVETAASLRGRTRRSRSRSRGRTSRSSMRNTAESSLGRIVGAPAHPDEPLRWMDAGNRMTFVAGPSHHGHHSSAQRRGCGRLLSG
jgi:hypothetical protein